MSRKILHLDLDAFFCAVEANEDESLRGKPFAVGGRPDQRGVVASCSYAARAFGIRSAMPMAQAVRRCPALLIIPQHRALYEAASRDVMAYLRTVTPLVEQLSIDEAFLDVTLLPDAAEATARRVQAAIRADLKLPCSLGVASNKLVAKIANTVGKRENKGDGPPNAITVVPPGQEAAFLAPLPVQELWGVGPKTAERLLALDITTIGDLARWPEADLARRFGKTGADLARRARGLDERAVITEHETKSISQETTFAQDIRDGDELRRVLRRLAEGVGRRLRQHHLAGRTVQIKLRWSDFTTITRQTTLDHPTDQDTAIIAAAQALFMQAWPSGRPVRLVGVGVSGLEEDVPRQLGLWDAVESSPSAPHHAALQQAIDDLRARHGDDIIKRAGDLHGEE